LIKSRREKAEKGSSSLISNRDDDEEVPFESVDVRERVGRIGWSLGTSAGEGGRGSTTSLGFGFVDEGAERRRSPSVGKSAIGGSDETEDIELRSFVMLMRNGKK
jgi:hypothetical protein